jgi:hypothetical protein
MLVACHECSVPLVGMVPWACAVDFDRGVYCVAHRGQK